MKHLKNLLFLVLLLSSFNGLANYILVKNLDDSGQGSLRWACGQANSGDTILVDVSGVIQLTESISLSNKSNVTIIGPTAKHLSIVASAGWTNGLSLFSLDNCTEIRIEEIAFKNGFLGVRAIDVFSTSGDATSKIIIKHCLFEGIDNTGFKGGAIAIAGLNIDIVNCSFVANQATQGGAIYMYDNGLANIVNCFFWGNSSQSEGGAIYFDGTAFSNLTHNTFFENFSSTGNGEVLYLSNMSSINVQNNAGAGNGSFNQVVLAGSASASSDGGNIFKTNGGGDSMPWGGPGDQDNPGITHGLRTTVKEDGFGLKYFPIYFTNSDFIDAGIGVGPNPSGDLRGAPRGLTGQIGPPTQIPDAGALEFTQNRVDDVSGGTGMGTIGYALTNLVDPVNYIEFDIPGLGPHEINPASQYSISTSVVIDGYSQPGSAVSGPETVPNPLGVIPANLQVEIIDNTGIPYGFEVTASSGISSRIQGLRIGNFENHGLVLNNTTEVFGCDIGLLPGAITSPNTESGVFVNADDCRIGGIFHWNRNVISGNGTSTGLQTNVIITQSTVGTIVAGNLIGIAQNGISPINGANATHGVYDQGTGTIIGMAVPFGGNAICNSDNGITAFDNSNLDIFNNKIGVAYDGTTVYPHSNYGIQLTGTSGTGGVTTYIGAQGYYGRNIIGGSGNANINIEEYSEVIMQNNYIGVDSTGAAAISGNNIGVLVNSTIASSIYIGTNGGQEFGNLISGNSDGINIEFCSSNVHIYNNKIGVDKGGNNAIPNSNDGIRIQSGATALKIGTATDGNIVSGNNNANGIHISGSNHIIEGNIIGLGINGATVIPNKIGINLNTAFGTQAGGLLLANASNVISGNTDHGILIHGGSDGNYIEGNLIGTNAAGTAPIGNGMNGVKVEDADNTFIGGPGSGYGNIIGGHTNGGATGIFCEFAGSFTTIYSNYIGVSDDGSLVFPNETGIRVTDTHEAFIGGIPGEENYICANTLAGIYTTSSNTYIDGNYIGIGPGNISSAQGNHDGIRIEGEFVEVGSTFNRVNVISNNTQFGININGDVADSNSVNNCFIGVDDAGVAYPNNEDGIRILDGDGNYIGDIVPNTISANDLAGVRIRGTATGNEVVSNLIGTLTSDPSLSNEYGVIIEAGATQNIIGGFIIGNGNEIVGNTEDGILIDNADDNEIISNFIGTSGSNADAPNKTGVRIINSFNVIVGGEDSNGNGTYNVISNNLQNGIVVDASNDTEIYGNRIGTNVTGNGLSPNVFGISVINGSNNTYIGTSGNSLYANTISGNDSVGVKIDNSTNTYVYRNKIGISFAGASALNNQQTGIEIKNGASSNYIGGNKLSEGNIIAGNTTRGIHIIDADNNYVEGNLIGLVFNNNQQIGVTLEGSSCNDNIIGGIPMGVYGNVISQNTSVGVHIDNGANLNTIQANLIGLDTMNLATSLNQGIGVAVTSSAGSDNYIGADVPGGGNVISGNSTGVQIDGAADHYIFNNKIGTDTLGMVPVPNIDGVKLTGGANSNLVGGSGPNQSNLVSGNTSVGIHLENAGTDQNFVYGNTVGANVTGTGEIPNNVGIVIATAAQDNYIGNSGAGNGNLVGGNDGPGIVIFNASGNYVLNNLVGTNFANNHGIVVNGGSSNFIGGAPGEGNVVAGNDSIGIGLFMTNGNVISSNNVGILGDGMTPNGQLYGISLQQSTGNFIGSSTSGEQNIISSNTYYGIGLEVNSNGNTVQNNYLGTGSTGSQVFGGTSNGNGIYIGGSDGNLIGGDWNLNEGNVVCFSSQHGIWLDGATSTTITGNNIGLSKNNDVYLGNTEDGVRIDNGSTGNFIGLSGNGNENVITDNIVNIHVKGSSGNFIENNFIGNDELGGDGSVSTGTNNSTYGIFLDTLSVNNQIIGANVISGNQHAGIGIGGPGTTGNIVRENYIGVSLSGSNSYSNDSVNVYIFNGASQNTIGGTQAQGNIIGGDNVIQVVLKGNQTDSNQVAGNYIGVGEDQSTTYSTLYGVAILDSASYNIIGGGNPNEGNIISVTDSHAIYLGDKTSYSKIQGNTIGLLPNGSAGAINGAGVRIHGSDWNQIGGLLLNSDSANVITNCLVGVDVLHVPLLNSSYGNAIIGNSIYNNVGMGIDIDADGAIHPIDTNQNLWNNGGIDFPKILTAWNCGTNNFTHVGIEFYSNNALAGYRVEFYANTSPDGNNHGEGEIYLGDWVFDPDTNVDTIAIDLGQTLTVGTSITATITGTLLNTSEFSENYTVTVPPTFNPPTTIDETCLGAGNAEVQIDAPEAYYFSLDGGLTNTYGIGGDTLYDIANGAYQVDATYLNGCVLSQNITLNPGPDLPFSTSILEDTCGLGVGYILIDTISTNGAGGTGDYVYTYDGGLTYLDNIDSTGLLAGTYDIGLQDTTLGCYSVISAVTVNEITDVVDESFAFDDFCPGDTPLPYNIATSGGTWNFNPSPGDGATIDVATGEITNSVIGNNYTVEYTVGICNEVYTVLVNAADSGDATFFYDPFCLGSTPTIQVIEGGGVWSFNPDPGTANIDPSSGLITGQSGTYQVQYVTTGTCPDTAVNAVIVYDTPAAPSITSTDSLYCPDEAIQPMLAPTGSTLTFNWFDDVGLTNNVASGGAFTPALLITGINDFYLVSSDANGCESAPGVMNYLLVDTSPMKAEDDQDVCIGSVVELRADGGASYIWTTSNQITGDLDAESTLAKILISEDFYVQITDIYGCVVMDTIKISLLSNEDCEVTVYNAFSPNGDSVNDYWEIDGIEGYPENIVIVYNRWGDVLIDFQNYNNADVVWDGTNRSGKQVPAGTYFFVVEVGGDQNQAGWVQVVK